MCSCIHCMFEKHRIDFQLSSGMAFLVKSSGPVIPCRIDGFSLSPQQKALKPQFCLCTYASLVDCLSYSGGSRKNQYPLEICSTVLNNGRGPTSITHSNFAVLFCINQHACMRILHHANISCSVCRDFMFLKVIPSHPLC